MPYQFSVYDTFDQLPIAWHKDGMEVQHLCKAIDIVEKSRIDQVKNYYVIVNDFDKPVFMAYYQLLSVTPDHFNLNDKKIQQFALSCALRLVKPTLLVAGNLFRHDALFFQFLEPSVTEAEKSAIYNATTEFMIVHTNASGIFLKDIPESLAESVLNNESYIRMENDISMQIKIPTHWKNFADYEKELKHKYLQRCKKIRKSFNGVSIRAFSLEDVMTYSKTMEQLYLQVTRKQLVSMGVLNASFFEELKKSLGEQYQVCGFFYENRLIAFSSAILHDGAYDMNYIGFDYALNQSHNLYFNILFHCLENTLATQSHTLILGRTALEAKAILGCSADYRYSFYKLRNVIVNWFFQMVSSYFKEQQGDKWIERHPFKSSFYNESVPS